MKKLRQKGLTYLQIATSLKINLNTVQYHLSPSATNPEYLEKRRKYNREYQKRRYNNDPEFRRKILNAIAKHHKEKRATDPRFRKWVSQISVKNHLIWRKKQQQKHPAWSATCATGAHETGNYTSRCKNKKKTCKCPCHKKITN